MDFMSDYWQYLSRYEISRNYAFWTAFGLLSALVHRKVVFLHGDIELHGNIFTLNVGPQGNGKSTANDLSRKFFQRVCPDLAVGAANQSAEAIVKTMSQKEFAVDIFTNGDSEQVIVRPYAFFINEFKDFIAYNPTRMLNFLGNIYDRKFFDANTIIRGAEVIQNPSLTVSACENPDQLIGFMKNNIVTGGISRRFVIVNELGYEEPRPFIAQNKPLEEKIISRLIQARAVVGKFQWAPSGASFYEPWYRKKQLSLPTIGNSIMRGYISTKHIQLFKICMLLDAVADKPTFTFTDDLLQQGLSFLDSLEENMPKLSIAAGRNDLMGPQQRILELIKHSGGFIPEKTLMKEIEGDLKPFEIPGIIQHLIDTDQAIKQPTAVENSEGRFVDRYVIFTPDGVEALMKANRLTIKDKKFHLMKAKL